MRFVVVHQREPHARQMAFADVPQPTSCEERAELARALLGELRLDLDVWIDDMGDTSRALFGQLPHPAIVVDALGIVRRKLSWCDPEELRRTLPDVLRAQDEGAVARAEDGFLAAIAEAPGAAGTAGGEGFSAHHRAVMLGHLVLACPGHGDRPRWLAALATAGPARQRAWAVRLQDSAGAAR